MKRARLRTPLKLVLAAEGRSQVWLARTLGVDPRQVWGWVNGLHIPGVATQGMIASALPGHTVEELWPDASPDAEREAAA
jgi:lambda repressor-like predicted transcriptional regulator